MSTELTTTTRANPFALTTFQEVETMANYMAESQIYGIKKAAQAVTLLMMAYEERITIVQLMRQIHVMEDGKISQRADWTQAQFEKGGTILWHCRNDEAACATFFKTKEISDADIDRAAQRCELLRTLDDLRWTEPRDITKERKVESQIAKLARPNEETVLRTLQNMDLKGTSIGKNDARKANWATSSESMLQWRVVTAGVKVVDPGVLNGMPSEIELRDALDYERRERARLTNSTTISEADAPSILKMIEQYDAELATDITDGRRKTLQGLRMDLVCKLADIGLKPPTEPEAPAPTVGGQPATVVETVVLPPEKTATPPAPKTRQARPTKPTVAPADADEVPMTFAWQDTPCHLGEEGGKMNGHKLGDIFAAAKTERAMLGLVKWFTDALEGRTEPKDASLLKAVQEAKAAWKPGTSPETPKTPASAPATPVSTPATSTAPEPAQTPALATGWRNYEVKSLNPDWNLKKLGELAPETIKAIHTEHLPKIDWKRAGLEQKSLKANVALAMADLFPTTSEPDLPLAAKTETPAHIEGLFSALETNKWDPRMFLSVCKLNCWVSDAHHTVNDITPEETEQLTTEWATVKAEMEKATQPAQQP